MKRLLCVLMSILLTVGLLGSACAVEYTLPEKMDRQLKVGSGLKGSFSFSCENIPALEEYLSPFADAIYQLRGISSMDDYHYYIYQADENENPNARTELYRHGDQLYLRSDLLGERVFSFPILSETADQLLHQQDKNISFASALIRLLGLSEQEKQKWIPLLTTLESRIESWAAQYSGEPRVNRQTDGSILMDLDYVIPAEDMKKEILTLLKEIASDESVQPLLDSVLTAEQKQIYFNPNLEYFYEEALNALALNDDIHLARSVTTMGDIISSSIEFPLDESVFRFSSVELDNRDGLNSITLVGEEERYTLILPEHINREEDGKISIWLLRKVSSGESGSFSVRADITRSSQERTDEDTREHLIQDYTLHVERDISHAAENAMELFPEFDDIDGKLSLHFHSKYAQVSPTTLEINLDYQQKEAKFSLSGSFKTASPWVFTPFDISKTESGLKLSEQEWDGILNELIKKAKTIIRKDAVVGETNQ